MPGFLCSMVGANFEPAAPSTVTLNAVSLDQLSDDYRTAAAGFVTSSDYVVSQKITASAWVRVANFNNRKCMFTIRTNQAPLLFVVNTNGSTRLLCGGLLDTSTPAGTISATNTWFHIAYSVDTTDVNKRHVFVDGVSVAGSTFGTYNSTGTFLSANTSFSAAIGGNPDGGAIGGEADAEFCQIYIDNSFIDLSTNISKFYNNGPVDMGTNGTASTLVQPLIYHNGNITSNPLFETNGGRTSTNKATYTLALNGTPTSSVGPSTITDTPGYYLYTQSTGETQANGIFDGQVAVMGHNTNGTIRAAYTGNNSSSLQGFVKPILYNPVTNVITFGAKVNCMQYTSAVIYGLKTTSETEYNIGTADATNFGITYLPNNNSPGPLVSVYPFSMDSTGAVTVGTYATLSLSNVGTAAAATDIAFDGAYNAVPRYTLFSRVDTGTANMYAISRSANTLSITRTFSNVFGTAARAIATGSFAGVGDASSVFFNSGADVAAVTFGATTRASAGQATGITGPFPSVILISGGVTAKYMIYGNTTTVATSRIINATYSASVTPTVTLGASLYQENASTRPVYKMVKSWNPNEAFLFFIESNLLKVKIASVNGDVITWSSEITIGALTAGSFDIMPAYVNASSQYFMGVAFASPNTTAFSVRLITKHA